MPCPVDQRRPQAPKVARVVFSDVVRFVGTLGETDRDGYLKEVEQSDLRDKNRHWLEPLVDDPIVVIGERCTNGQHRACPLRFSGATLAVLVSNTEELGEEADDWVVATQRIRAGCTSSFSA
jgi:hypothetical protein